MIHDGDLVSLDCGLILEGWWADSGLSVACGDASPLVHRLIDVTREALDLGIAAAKPGNHIGDIGAAVQRFVESNGFSVVRQYVGHGIGRDMHELPQIPNYGTAGTGNMLKPGYVIAIEPMVNAGRAETRVLDDDWTVVTVRRQALLLLRAHDCNHRIRTRGPDAPTRHGHGGRLGGFDGFA